jgi:hypothetical protein
LTEKSAVIKCNISILLYIINWIICCVCLFKEEVNYPVYDSSTPPLYSAGWLWCNQICVNGL